MLRSNNTTKICLPHSLCGNFRDCGRCAAIRQAKIANAVEKLEAICGKLTWHILYPHGGQANEANKAKLQFLKAAKAEGAIWTIEQSKKNNNFHVNIITPECQTPELRKAHVWHQQLDGNVRNVGAYIAKRSQMPTREAYDGKLFGTAGNLWQILSQAKEMPIVQAAAAQYAIDSHAMINRAAKLKELEKKSEGLYWNPEIEAEKNRLRELLKGNEEEGKKYGGNRSDFINVEELNRQFDKEAARERAAKWLPDIIQNQYDIMMDRGQKKT